MVTAIVIPIICFYFYWLTKKEMKENDEKWLASGNVKREAKLAGEIVSIAKEKQRYYYHRYIYIQTLKLQTGSKTVTAIKITPSTKNIKLAPFAIGDRIIIYGSWEGSKFLFNDHETETPVIR